MSLSGYYPFPDFRGFFGKYLRWVAVEIREPAQLILRRIAAQLPELATQTS
jgi:hypothetical protein